MNTSAIVLMLVAMLIIWGGLALAIHNLGRKPEVSELPSGDEIHRDL